MCKKARFEPLFGQWSCGKKSVAEKKVYSFTSCNTSLIYVHKLMFVEIINKALI